MVTQEELLAKIERMKRVYFKGFVGRSGGINSIMEVLANRPDFESPRAKQGIALLWQSYNEIEQFYKNLSSSDLQGPDFKPIRDAIDALPTLKKIIDQFFAAKPEDRMRYALRARKVVTWMDSKGRIFKGIFVDTVLKLRKFPGYEEYNVIVEDPYKHDKFPLF